MLSNQNYTGKRWKRLNINIDMSDVKGCQTSKFTSTGVATLEKEGIKGWERKQAGSRKERGLIQMPTQTGLRDCIPGRETGLVSSAMLKQHLLHGLHETLLRKGMKNPLAARQHSSWPSQAIC